MSYADKVFKNTLNTILTEGTSDQNLAVRPRWEDGTPAHTIAKFGVITRYDLSKNFPLITLRNPYLKSAVEEMLWIWQKKSNNIHDLKTHVWDAWADKNGSIGKAYGYQQAQFYAHKGITVKGLKKAFPDIKKGLTFGLLENSGEMGDDTYGYGFEENCLNQGYDFINHPIAIRVGKYYYMTQIDKVIYDLHNNLASRRMIVTMWNPKDLSRMALEPCAHTMTFSVIGNKLNGILHQRSQDFLTAFAWNECQYASLVLALASIYGFEPGEFIHEIANCHIYDRHIPIAEKLANAPEHDEPIIKLNPDVKSFYDLKPNDFIIENYTSNPFNTKIPVAV